MACKPQWADTPRVQCNQRGISNRKRKRIKKLLTALKYEPASVTVDEVYGDILLLLDYFDEEIH
jgi:hypothetical protein